MKSIYVIAYSAEPGNPEFSCLDCYDQRHSEFETVAEAQAFCSELRTQGFWSVDDHLLDSPPIELSDTSVPLKRSPVQSDDPVF